MTEAGTKVVFIGDSGAGKTSLMRHLLNQEFDPSIESNVAGSSVDLIVDSVGRGVRLSLWDTAGQETFRALTPLYFRHARVAFICYAVPSDAPIDVPTIAAAWKTSVTSWLNTLRETNYECQLLLVTTKTDLLPKEHREAWIQQAESLKDALGFDSHFMTSARTGDEAQAMISRTAEIAEFIRDESWKLFPPKEAPNSCGC
jgi:small GTP-binding protein